MEAYNSGKVIGGVADDVAGAAAKWSGRQQFDATALSPEQEMIAIQKSLARHYNRLAERAYGNSGTVDGLGVFDGAVEVSGRTKSLNFFRNGTWPDNVEYIFDFESGRMALGKAQLPPALKKELGGSFVSPHETLAMSVGADRNSTSIIGGHISRDVDGTLLTTQFSGHYHQNWTESRQIAFQKFLEALGFRVNHSVL